MTVSDGHCLALGKCTVAFSELDFWLSSFAWALIGQDQHIGQIVTAEMSFARKIDLVGSLFKHVCPDKGAREDLQRLLGKLSQLEQRRNTAQHSLWIRQSEDPELATRLKVTAKRQHGLKHAKEDVTSEPLEGLARDLQAATSDFSSFMVTFLSPRT